MRTLALTLALLPLPVFAQSIDPRDGWEVRDTDKPYAATLDALKAAVKANGMNVVTEAGPTDAAKAQGVTLPGNRVIGVFAVKYAIAILPLSTPAMIEAPIRFYITEDPDGSATLSWKRPSFVFAPYAADAGEPLEAIAVELDTKFDAIAAEALAN